MVNHYKIAFLKAGTGTGIGDLIKQILKYPLQRGERVITVNYRSKHLEGNVLNLDGDDLSFATYLEKTCYKGIVVWDNPQLHGISDKNRKILSILKRLTCTIIFLSPEQSCANFGLIDCCQIVYEFDTESHKPIFRIQPYNCVKNTLQRQFLNRINFQSNIKKLNPN